MNSHLKDQAIIESDRREELAKLFAEQNIPPNEFLKHEEVLKHIESIVKKYPQLIPPILKICGDNLDEYRRYCLSQNNFLLREALGDAVHLLGMERKPDKKKFADYCVRIKKVIFSNGITSYHHEGERNFFNRFLKEDK